MKSFLSLGVFFLAFSPAVAELHSVAPSDRLAFGARLARMGMYAEALAEFSALAGEKSVPRDEIFFRMADAHRNLANTNDALHYCTQLLTKYPGSRFADYARLNKALLLTGAERAKNLRDLDRDSAPKDVRAEALFHLAELMDAKANPKAVADLYLRAADCAPTAEKASFARIRAAGYLSGSKDPAERRRAMKTYLDLALSSDARFVEESLFCAAMLGYGDGRYEFAIKLFTQLMEKFPDGVHARQAAVYAAWSNYLMDKFAATLRLVTESGAADEDSRYLKAAALRRLERRGEALAAYDAYLKDFPSGRFADRAWGNRLALRSEVGDARGVLADLESRGDPPGKGADRAFLLGAEAAASVTNFPLALQYARRAADSADPGVAARALFCEGSYDVRVGRSEAAIAAWTQLLARYPDCAYAEAALRARAMEEIRLRDYKAARRSFDELARRFPAGAKTADRLYWRGLAARFDDDAPEAERLFREARAANPSAEFAREIDLELAYLMQRRGAKREAADAFLKVSATKAVDRLAPATLAWSAEVLLAAGDATNAVKLAALLDKRNADASWNQIAAYLLGAAHEALHEMDAAVAAYRRAYESAARTDAGAAAALAFGCAEIRAGHYEEAKDVLLAVVERARSEQLRPIRVKAYAALAENEEKRNDREAALRYHMLVGTLYDDPEVTPRALSRAVALLRELGKAQAADELVLELAKRYPDWKPAPEGNGK